jgi:hypothetical protein
MVQRKQIHQDWDGKCAPELGKMCTKAQFKNVYQNWIKAELGLKMHTRTRIEHAYQGVQGVCPQQAVTKHQRHSQVLASAVPYK